VYFDATVNEVMLDKLSRPVALAYYGFLVLLIINRFVMFNIVEGILGDFERNIKENYRRIKEQGSGESLNLESLEA